MIMIMIVITIMIMIVITNHGNNGSNHYNHRNNNGAAPSSPASRRSRPTWLALGGTRLSGMNNSINSNNKNDDNRKHNNNNNTNSSSSSNNNNNWVALLVYRYSSNTASCFLRRCLSKYGYNWICYILRDLWRTPALDKQCSTNGSPWTVGADSLKYPMFLESRAALTLAVATPRRRVGRRLLDKWFPAEDPRRLLVTWGNAFHNSCMYIYIYI